MQGEARPQPARTSTMAAITNDWMPRTGRMDAYLVGSARLQSGLNEAHSVRGAQSLKVSGRGLVIDVGLPDAARARIACDNSQVAACDSVTLEAMADGLVGRAVDGEEHQARGGGVESMVQADVRKARAQLSIEVRLVGVGRGGGCQTMGLVDDDDALILVSDGGSQRCHGATFQAVTLASWTTQPCMAALGVSVSNWPAGSP